MVLATPTSAPFLPHCATLSAEGAAPTRWMLMLHGIYGRGANWRAVARALSTHCPDWGFILVDLRMHGASMDAPSPHTLEACARDVIALIEQQREEGRQVRAILGHSFGGKVALEAQRLGESLSTLWLIDSSPGARPGAMDDPNNTVVSVLRMLQTLPQEFANRSTFVDTVVARGFPKALADWLAMNLERSDEHYRCMLDPSAMQALLEDYFQADRWQVLEHSAEPVRCVVATRSSALSSAEQERLADLQREGRAIITHIEGSHWLHVDGFAELVEYLRSALC